MHQRHRVLSGGCDANENAAPLSTASSNHANSRNSTDGFLIPAGEQRISLSKKRSCSTALRKAHFHYFSALSITSFCLLCWFWLDYDLSDSYYNTYHDIATTDWVLSTAAMSTTGTNSTAETLSILADQELKDLALLDVDGADRCAILFYGLPRSFRLLVLPSVLQNIIRPNARYRCDYFVHYYDSQEFEAPSRSGYGGFVNTSEILLLQQAVHEQQQVETTTFTQQRSSNVYFTKDTNASFWQYQSGLYSSWMHKIRQTKGKRRFVKQHPKNFSNQLLYLPVKDASYNFQTLENILKMWHSQSSVYRLMMEQQHEENTGNVNYSRVALFRSDAVYVTPIDIWKRATASNNDGVAASSAEDDITQNNTNNSSQVVYEPQKSPAIVQQDGSRVLDVDNTQAVIPAFAKHPVNDRMFYGPAAAAKIWATQRLARLENHVQEHILRFEPGFGMHSERYLYYTIFPAIRNETQVDIAEDENICLLRARADESVWINDCGSSGQNDTSSKLEEYRAMIEGMIGRTCRQSRLPEEIHTRVIQLRCGSVK